MGTDIQKHLAAGAGDKLARAALRKIKDWDYDALRRFCDDLAALANGKASFVGPAVDALTALIDTPCHTGLNKRASVLQILHLALHVILDAVPPVESKAKSSYKRVAWKNRKKLRAPARGEATLAFEPACASLEGLVARLERELPG